MNRASRYRQWLKVERRRKAIARIWSPRIEAALNAQIKAITSSLKWEGLFATKLNLDHLTPTEGLKVVLGSMYIRAGVSEASLTYGTLKTQKFSGLGQNKEWTKLIKAYLKRYLLDKSVTPITSTTKKIIRTLLEQATEEGWGVDETIKKIQEKTGELTRARVQNIVRTESVRAMNIGSLAGAHSSRLVLDKRWITARDERVRGTHRHLDGKLASMEEAFEGSVLAFPGDPNGKAKDVCNCRCTLAFEPRRDENGRLIRKPQISEQPYRRGAEVTEGFIGGLLLGSLVDELIS